MNVLVLAPQPFFARRGTPIAVRGLATALARQGHQVDLLTYHYGERITIPGVKIWRTARHPLVRQVPIGLSWQKVVCDVAMLRRALALVEERRPDVVHAVEEAVFIAWLIQRRYGIPFVYDMDSVLSDAFRDGSVLARPFAPAAARLERAAIRRAAGVLAVCPALAEHARAAAPDAHIRVLPDTPVADEGAADGSPSDLEEVPGTRFLYVGNLERYQGVSLLLDAFRLAAPECSDATLFIIGGKEDHIRAHARRVPELVRAGRVRFLGERPLEELNRHLAAADVLASPRRSGVNTPLKVYSYMQAAKPILATRQQTHTQVLDDTTALLTKPEPAAMAAGIRALAGSAELRNRLGEAARERVESEYSVARFRGRLQSFYADLPLADPSVAAV